MLKMADMLGQRKELHQHPEASAPLAVEVNKLIVIQIAQSVIPMQFFAACLDPWQLFIDLWNESSKATRQLWTKVKQSGCTLSAIGEERVSLNSTD